MTEDFDFHNMAATLDITVGFPAQIMVEIGDIMTMILSVPCTRLALVSPTGSLDSTLIHSLSLTPVNRMLTAILLLLLQ